MEKKFVDHLFSKIIEGKHDSALSSMAAKSKLEQLEDIGEQIRKSMGDDGRENVLGYAKVKRALEQCIDFIENPNSEVSDTDFSIYYSYAATRLKKAEAIIDAELSDYGF